MIRAGARDNACGLICYRAAEVPAPRLDHMDLPRPYYFGVKVSAVRRHRTAGGDRQCRPMRCGGRAVPN